jgi:threonyl-tRNA synthetase
LSSETRDHRKIGKQLELFHFDETAKGMPYWLPNGMRVRNQLIAYWREAHEKNGYDEIASPLLNDKQLWERSGHWEYNRENIFQVQVDDDTEYGLKPMNCPSAMIVFGLKPRSYRDLPMRLSDCGIVHRHERSTRGLFQAREFQQDDAHIFCETEQVAYEIDRILNLAEQFYSTFNLTFSFRLALRPDNFMGDAETWDGAEASLKSILDKRVGEGSYVIIEKEGAFYGPKIDILMKDSIGRKWQMGTIQLDLQLPNRFALTYIDRDGKQRAPVVIHRAIYGSIDRFIGILLEHTNGDLPLWLSPTQVVIVPIADRHNEYAGEIAEKLSEKNVRVKIDADSARMNKKIRDWELLKVPFIAVIGDRETQDRTLSIRARHGEQEAHVPSDKFVDRIASAIKART